METLTGFGITYEKPISFDACRKLLKKVKIPKIGFQQVVRTGTDNKGINRNLTAYNIKNRIILASSAVEKHDWKEVFGINV